MNKKELKELILERNPDAIFLPKEFDKALIGTSIQCGKTHVATYDNEKCIQVLMSKENIGEIDAYEEYEILVKYVNNASDNQPIIFSNFENTKKPDLPFLNEDMTIADLL